MSTSNFELKRFGKYLLLEKAAQGGMAQLFRAKITGVEGFEKFIAIKRILPHLAEEKELVGSFIDEAKLAALLNHQNIVQIYDFGHIQDTYFISMEYLFGKDIRRILEKSKERGLFMSTEHALYVTSRTCSALDYAHKLKNFQGNLLHIIHRDVSPQNVFVTYEGEVKILDFGIAKAASQSNLTQVGMIKGKVAYMSPEQAAGKTIDHRSDIFATGILLYEMVTNMRMFTGDTMQVLAQVREARIPWPVTVERDLPQQILDVLRRALTKEPEERYQSCGEMLADIEKCMIELSMRPTTQGLAKYMKDLFKEEIAAESEVMREAAAISIAEELEPAEVELPAGKSPQEALGVAEQVVQALQKKKVQLLSAVTAILVVSGLVFVFWPKGEPGKDVSTTTAQHPVSQTPVEIAQAEISDTEEISQAKISDTEEIARAEISDTEEILQAEISDIESKGIVEEASKSDERVKTIQKEAEKLVETDPQEARTLLLEWIELEPKSVDAYSRLGLVYVKLKDYPKAIETYQKAAELDPQAADIYFNLGYVYASSKDYAKAEEMYGEAVKLTPPYMDEVLFNLAMVQERQGRLKESIVSLERAISVNPNNTLAREYLEKLEKRSGGKQ